MNKFRLLEAQEVLKTAEALALRIKARFPEASLLQVAEELVRIARETEQRTALLGKPILLLRLFLILICAAFVGLVVLVIQDLSVAVGPFSLIDLLQGLESATNELILLSAGALFLTSIEGRIKRARGLKALHELRSIAHIIDLHQLTKDPARLESSAQLWTPVSPKLDYDAFLLSRYLDYCSELLSIIGKIAALYAQKMQDPALLEAVDGVEALTSGASRKIWQKIMIIQSH